jgi:hypothetical protein
VAGWGAIALDVAGDEGCSVEGEAACDDDRGQAYEEQEEGDGPEGDADIVVG